MIVRVTVTLPEDVLARLDEIARDESLTRSDVVREAAAHYVADREGAEEARLRRQAVEGGVAWLEDLSSRATGEDRSSLDVLRELRGGSSEIGMPIRPEKVPGEE